MTRGISMKFSMKYVVHKKKEGLNLSLENTFLEKPQGRGDQIKTPAFLGLIDIILTKIED